MAKDWRQIPIDEVLNYAGAETAVVARYERIMSQRTLDELRGLWGGIRDLRTSLHTVSANLEARMIAAEAAEETARIAEESRRRAEARRQTISLRIALSVAALTAIYASFAGFQWWTIRGQLDEMKTAAGLTERSIDISEKSMTASQRAWIAPRSVKVDGKVEVGQPISFSVLFDNPGHEPALNVRHAFHIFEIDVPRVSNRVEWLAAMKAPESDTCGGPTNGSEGVAYPSSQGSNPYTISDLATDFLVPDGAYLDSFLHGDRVLILLGCFRYNTLGEGHRSAFCGYLTASPEKTPDKWTFSLCANGNFAN